MKIVKIQNDSEINTIMESGKYTKFLLQLSATWCAPCMHISPLVEEYVSSIYNPTCVFIYCDVDKCAKLYNYMNVPGIPSFVSIIKNSDGKYDVNSITSGRMTDIRLFCKKYGITSLNEEYLETPNSQ